MLVTISALVAAAGAALMAWLAWDGSLFMYHPLLMWVGLVLSGVSGAMSVQMRHGTAEPRERKQFVLIHGGLMGAAVVCAGAGLAAIYFNKERNHAEHFTSTHSWVGLAAMGLFTLNLLGGALKSGGLLCKSPQPFKEPMHRIGGLLALCTAMAAIYLGLESKWSQNAFTQEVRYALMACAGVPTLLVLLWAVAPPKASDKKD